MSDFSFTQNNINQVQLPWADIDIDTKNGDFLQDNFLETSMMISLFSNAPANTDELNRFNDDQLNKAHNRGWFGSTYTAGIEYGSKLWLLERERRNQETLNLARQYCKEALQWIINEGISSKIDVECSWNADVLVINIEVHREFDENIIKQYSYVWDNMLAPKDLKEYNVLWKRFDNNVQVGVFSINEQPIDDVGYLCVDKFLVRAYNAGLTYKAPTYPNPSFTRQCDTGDAPWPPTDESHLIGWPLKDFDGSTCATTYLGSNYRLYQTQGTNGTIVNGKYHTSLVNLETSSIRQTTVFLPNGSLKIKLQQTTAPLFENQAGASITVNGVNYACLYVDNGDGTCVFQVKRNGVIQHNSTVTPQSVLSIEIRWGVTGINCLINDLSRFTDVGNTGSSEILQQVNVENIAAGNSEYDFFDYEVRDAATGGNIYYMPMLDQYC